MKAILIKLISNYLPYIFVALLGSYLANDWYNTKSENREYAITQSVLEHKLSVSEQALKNEREWFNKRQQWIIDYSIKTKELDKTLDDYKYKLRVIENERNKNNINNSLSDDVIRVLKEFNNPQ